MKLNKNDNKGFTLVELIVVVVILAILIGVTIGGIFVYVEDSRRNTDINNATAIQNMANLSIIDMEFNETFKDMYIAAHGSVGEGIVRPYFICWKDACKILNSVDGSNTFQNNTSKAFVDSFKGFFPDGLPESKTGYGFSLVFYWNSDTLLFEGVKCISLAEVPIQVEKLRGTPYHACVKSRTGTMSFDLESFVGTIFDKAITYEQALEWIQNN